MAKRIVGWKAGLRVAFFLSAVQTIAFLLRKGEDFAAGGSRLLFTIALYCAVGSISGAFVDKYKERITSTTRAVMVGFILAIPLGVGLHLALDLDEVGSTMGDAVGTVLLFALVFGGAGGAGLYRSLTASPRNVGTAGKR